MRRIAVLAVLFVLAGCDLVKAPVTLPPLLASVDTPDGVAGVFRDVEGVHLWIVGQDTGGKPDQISDAPTVHLFTTGGDTGLEYNSFVFGLAPAGSVRVELEEYETIGGDVVNGTYVLAIRDKDILPQDLHWTFLSSQDTVIAKGSNITNE